MLRHLSNTLASDSSKAQRSIDEQLLELQFDEILSLTRTLFVHMLRLLRAARVWLSQLIIGIYRIYCICTSISLSYSYGHN